MSKRLIEEWLPIAFLGIESVRERTPMTPFPAPNRLHVWWARRPLVAARAAVLASLLPAGADRAKFLHVLGIHGDPVTTKRKLDLAKKTGENLGLNPYGYDRAFKYNPNEADRQWIAEELQKLSLTTPKVLDPTAGGGSIPMESIRLGFDTLANDLNPVAVLVQKATYEWPIKYGRSVLDEFNRLSKRFIEIAEPKFRELDIYPKEPEGTQVLGYLWARTIVCPYCDGLIPLSPNWKLAPDGTGVKLLPQLGGGVGTLGRVCQFQIVPKASDQSPGTVNKGSTTCPYPDCGRVVTLEQLKEQGDRNEIGEQLFAVVYKERVIGTTKTGRSKEKWVRGYRAPQSSDDINDRINNGLEEKCLEWTTLDLIPSEPILEGLNTNQILGYGVTEWTEMFSPRQLLCHGTSVEVFRELLAEEEEKGALSDVKRAAFGYLALALDKFLNWNARLSSWNVQAERLRSVFDRHDFAFKWSFGEMAPLIAGLGYDWTFEQTSKCIEELLAFTTPTTTFTNNLPLFNNPDTPAQTSQTIHISNESGDSLDHLDDASLDAVILDPPYYDNVMYAELSDFFYVWLKRTAGHLYPQLFTRHLTDKDQEAVANPAKFKGQKGAKALAGEDYKDRMAAIFTEARRVLKPDGIMTLMFTHKATGAWDALTKGLIEAGFVITASWPINTEAEGSLHIKDKSAANSTIFLVCRPRPAKTDTSIRYWEDLEPLVTAAVRRNITQFQTAGIRGVDLYLSCFGPALEEFSRHWPVQRSRPRPEPTHTSKRRTQNTTPPDPYSVTPEDALDAARAEVKRWRIEQLVTAQRNPQLDPLTEWFVLAWDAFQAPQFPYDEALRLARVVGLDLDKDVVKVLAEKKSSTLILWDSATRVAKGAIGPTNGSKGLIDTLHHCAHLTRTQSLTAAKDLLETLQLLQDPRLCTALEAVLEVLPPSRAYTGIDPAKAILPAANDWETLENLRRLAFTEQIDPPTQLALWQDLST